MAGGLLLQAVYFALQAFVFTPSVPAVMGFIIAAALIFALAVVIKNKVKESLAKVCIHDNPVYYFILKPE